MNKYTKIKTKPIPYDLFGGEENRCIKYRCRRCGADFSYYRTEENHCHKCGEEIDWNVPLVCSERFRAEYNIIKAEHSGAELKKKMTNLFYKEFAQAVGETKRN